MQCYRLGPHELGEEVAVISPFVWDLTPCFLSKSRLCSEHKSTRSQWLSEKALRTGKCLTRNNKARVLCLQPSKKHSCCVREGSGPGWSRKPELVQCICSIQQAGSSHPEHSADSTYGAGMAISIQVMHGLGGEAREIFWREIAVSLSVSLEVLTFSFGGRRGTWKVRDATSQ